MRRQIIFFYAIFSTILFFPLGMDAQSVFEIDQNKASRTSLDLEGGYPEDFAIESDGTFWVATNSPNGIFYWNGSTFVQPPEEADFGTVSDVEVSSSSVFIVGGISLYRSQDGGASWAELTGVSNVSQYLFHNGTTLFVPLRNGNLAVSNDEGDTFTELTIDAAATGEVLSMSSSSARTYALLGVNDTQSALYYTNTTDNSTWIDTGKIISGASRGAVEVEAKPGDDNFLLVRSEDKVEQCDANGTNCSDIYTDTDGLADLEFSGDRIFMGKKYTDDDGANWNDIVGSGDNIRNDSLVEIDPSNPNNIYWKSMTGIIRTTDGGVTTAEMNTGLTAVTINGLDQSTDKETVCLAAIGGLALTTNYSDSNPTWQFPVVPNNSVSEANACWIDPDDSNYIVADFGTVYYTTDGGTTWTEAENTPTTVGEFLEVNGTLYAGHSNGLSMSTDNGQTWSSVDSAPSYVNALASDGSNIVLATGDENDSANNGLYLYDGSTFTQITDSGVAGYLFNDVIYDSAGTFYACSGTTESGTVVRSTDNGTTWTNLTDNGLPSDGWFHALAFDPDNTNIIYVSTARSAGNGYIYKTTNGGDDWSKLYTGLVDETFNTMLYDGLIAGTNTGVYNIYSKLKLKIKLAKKRVTKNRRVKITITVKDKATGKKLKNKRVTLKKKHKLSKKWKKIKTKKTNKKGKVTFRRKIKKKTYFRAFLKPKGNTAQAYGSSKYKSKRKVVKLKK